jgi:hypothetical protein
LEKVDGADLIVCCCLAIKKIIIVEYIIVAPTRLVLSTLTHLRWEDEIELCWIIFKYDILLQERKYKDNNGKSTLHFQRSLGG